MLYLLFIDKNRTKTICREEYQERKQVLKKDQWYIGLFIVTKSIESIPFMRKT